MAFIAEYLKKSEENKTKNDKEVNNGVTFALSI